MNFSRSALLHMKSRVRLKYFVNDWRFSPHLNALGHVYITYRWGELKVKNTTLGICILVRHFFVDFHKKIVVFLIFISFFDEVSNFRNRILTSQTPELVITICQWNCCQSFSENLLLGTLVICPGKALCISDENIFIKNFYTNYSFFSWIRIE